MENYSAQIARIKEKLQQAKKTDVELKVFGATSHKYEIGNVATVSDINAVEEKYNLQLPESYKIFLLHIGNGGNGYNNAAAGPFYGIFPLGYGVDEFITENTEAYLYKPCILHPKMTGEEWEQLIDKVKRDDISNEEWEKEQGKLFGGVLPIGSQGCSLLHCLVINGPHAGKVVNVDADLQKPIFTFETNFLDWYERWLDEIISKDLLVEGPCWFGYQKGGSEEGLVQFYRNIDDKDNLYGLLNKRTLKPKTLQGLQELLTAHPDDIILITQIICKSDYELAKPLLQQLINTDLNSFLKTIHWYAKDKSSEWFDAIIEKMPGINDNDTLKFCTYVLANTKTDFSASLLPFTQHNDAAIRVTAFYNLGQTTNKAQYLDYFIRGLQDTDANVLRTILQALANITDPALLPHCKQVALKFADDTQYVLTNLYHRLKEYNITKERLLRNKNY